MASTLVLALVNILFGLAVISYPKFLRYLIGGYFLLTGVLMILL